MNNCIEKQHRLPMQAEECFLSTIPKQANGLVLADRSQLIKLPEQMYQIYFSMAQSNPNRPAVKRMILRDIIGWVEDKYPGYALLNFWDFNQQKAKALSDKSKIEFTWGMYLRIQPFATTTERYFDEPIEKALTRAHFRHALNVE